MLCWEFQCRFNVFSSNQYTSGKTQMTDKVQFLLFFYTSIMEAPCIKVVHVSFWGRLKIEFCFFCGFLEGCNLQVPNCNCLQKCGFLVLVHPNQNCTLAGAASHDRCQNVQNMKNTKLKIPWWLQMCHHMGIIINDSLRMYFINLVLELYLYK